MTTPNRTPSPPIWSGSPEYEVKRDKNFYDILMYFLWENPCYSKSDKATTLLEQGWTKETLNDWSTEEFFYSQTFKTDIRKRHGEYSFKTNSKKDLAETYEDKYLGEDFYKHTEQERFVVAPGSVPDSDEKWLTLVYHLRQALAHGQIGETKTSNGILYFLEDRSVEKGQLVLSARIVIYKTTLIRIIDFFRKSPMRRPPFQDGVLLALFRLNAVSESNSVKKQVIINAFYLPLPITEVENKWDYHIQKFKKTGLIQSKNHKWFLTRKGLKELDKTREYLKHRYNLLSID